MAGDDDVRWSHPTRNKVGMSVATVYVEVVSLLFGAVFVWAGIAKLLAPGDPAKVMAMFLGPAWTRPGLLVLVAFELSTGAWLVCASRRRICFRVLAATMVMFCVVLLVLHLKDPAAHCGCLGLRESVRAGLFRNIILLLAAGGLLLMHRICESQGKEVAS